MEELPAELRLEIFRLVLYSETSLVQEAKENRQRYVALLLTSGTTTDRTLCSRLNTPLFLVNRQISREVQDAFFEVNTISTYLFKPEYQKLKLVRQLELKNQDVVTMLNQPLFFYNRILDLSYRLPYLRNVSIACEYFIKLGLTVREHFSFSARVEPHSIGVFELVPKFPLQEKIWAKNFELLKTLPEANLIASSYSLEELHGFALEGVNPQRGPACAAAKKRISFAYSLVGFQMMRRLDKEPPLSSSDRQHASVFQAIVTKPRRTIVGTRDLPLAHEELPEEVELTEVSLAKGQSPELVGWASDVLGHLLHWFTSSAGPQRMR